MFDTSLYTLLVRIQSRGYVQPQGRRGNSRSSRTREEQENGMETASSLRFRALVPSSLCCAPTLPSTFLDTQTDSCRPSQGVRLPRRQNRCVAASDGCVSPTHSFGNICGRKCYSRCRDQAVAEIDKVCPLLSPHPSGLYSDRKHCAQFFLKIHSPIVVMSALQTRKLSTGRASDLPRPHR